MGPALTSLVLDEQWHKYLHKIIGLCAHKQQLSRLGLQCQTPVKVKPCPCKFRSSIFSLQRSAFIKVHFGSEKKFGQKIIFGLKEVFSPENFWPEKNLGSQKMLGHKRFWIRKKLKVQNKLYVRKKNVVRQNIETNKIMGPKNVMPQKFFGLFRALTP